MKVGTEGKYIDLLNIAHRDDVVAEIEGMVSDISGDHHKIRSIILELHFAVEIELRRFLFHSLKRTILFEDEAEKAEKEKVLYKYVGKTPFGTMQNLLEASLHRAPWPDLEHAKAINATRNKMSHSPSIDGVSYKGRSPFFEPDCLAQMYFEVWAFKQEFAKLFWRTIEEPDWHLRYYKAAYEEYKNKYGSLKFTIKR